MSSEHSKSKSSDIGPPFSQKNDLEGTFKAYIKKFNPKVPESEDGFMDGRVWRHFVTNLDLAFGPERVSIGCEVFNTHHGAHVGRVETMNFEEFYKAIDDLLQRNENYCRARGETLLAPSRDTIKAEIIKKPVTTKISAKWINKSVKHLKDVLFSTVTHEAVGATAITLRAMAESSTEALMQVGCSVEWLKPIIKVFKVVWKHAEAYREIDGDIDEFASLLQYVSDALVYINDKDLYGVQNTKERLEIDLNKLLKKSEKVLKKVHENCKNKHVKRLTSRNDKLKLKEQEHAILNWLNSLQVMQAAENQAITRENNELLKEIEEYIKKELHEIKACIVDVQKSLQSLHGKTDSLEGKIDAMLLEVKESRRADEKEHGDIKARIDVMRKEVGEFKEALAVIEKLLNTTIETADDTKNEVIALKKLNVDLLKRVDDMDKKLDAILQYVLATYTTVNLLRQEQAVGFKEVRRDLAEHKADCAKDKAERAKTEAGLADRISRLEDQTKGKPIHPYEHGGQEVLDTTGNRMISQTSTAVEAEDDAKLDAEGRESITKFPLTKNYEKKKIRLGAGSYGHVYKWQHRVKETWIAVKEIPFEVTGTTNGSKEIEKMKQEEENLMKEVEILQKYRHEHIVAYLFHEYNVEDKTLFIAMEFMAGGSLKQLLKNESKLHEDIVISYTRQILRGVQFLHEHSRPVVHRDIKSANILLNETRTVVKLADFGISKQLKSTHPAKTKTAEKGTHMYMAPEALERKSAAQKYGLEYDIWGVGCVVLEMATGKHPWSNCSDIEVTDFIRDDKESPPVPSDLPDDMSEFISQTFTWNADKRPTARELLSHRMLRGDEPEKPVQKSIQCETLEDSNNIPNQLQEGELEKAFAQKLGVSNEDVAELAENVVKSKTVDDQNDIPGKPMQVDKPEKVFEQELVPADDVGADENVVKCKTVEDPNDVPRKVGDVTVKKSKKEVQSDVEMRRIRHYSYDFA